MAHVEDGDKYYIRKEYTEVSELNKHSEQPIIIQQTPPAGQQAAEPPQDGNEPPKEPTNEGNEPEEKEGVNDAD